MLIQLMADSDMERIWIMVKRIMDMADMDKSKNIPDMLCFKTLWALCCFEWAGYYTLMMLFYSLKILLEYISDRLVSRRNLSLDFGTFLTHHWKLEDPRTHNVSRSPNNQTADQGIPQGLLGRWAGGYIGLLGSQEYIVNINRRCYGCKRLFGPVLCIFANSYPQCEKMSTICFYKFIQAAISEHPKRQICFGICQ